MNKSTILSLGLILVSSTLSASEHKQKPIYFQKLEDTTLRFDRGTGSLARGKSGKLYILTVWHVCNTSDDGYMHGVTNDGRSYFGKITRYNVQDDICAVELPTEDIPSLSISHNFIQDAPIHYRGYPHLVLIENSGYILGLRRFDIYAAIDEVGECKGLEPIREPSGRLVACRHNFENYETTLFGRGGSSGSPVVDNQGNLIGLVDTGDGSGRLGIVTYKALYRFMENL